MAEKAVFRQLAIPVSAFDHINATQRAYAARHGEHLTVNQTVALIVHEHRNHSKARIGQLASLCRPLTG